MKDTFGFIERADVVKEIFFHFSEAEGSIELRPGDDVEFIIQTRNVSSMGNLFVINH
jgi:cold shock CspA family protein